MDRDHLHDQIRRFRSGAIASAALSAFCWAWNPTLEESSRTIDQGFSIDFDELFGLGAIVFSVATVCFAVLWAEAAWGPGRAGRVRTLAPTFSTSELWRNRAG